MPNCQICGKPVISAPVTHQECWKEWAEEQARKVCSYACKWEVICGDKKRMWEAHCKQCPLLELANIETALFKVLEL